MADEDQRKHQSSLPAAASTTSDSRPPPPNPPPLFDPSRMIGIIRRKALIKDLAALYHAECLASCQELLQLQNKWEEVRHVQPHVDFKTPEDSRKETLRPRKRAKKTR
ncbi:hypothetical protein RJ641_001794 [Dillenia turbinata]|uniref:Uncharacterized protein n=1 Tax=Dillenia turbinata TaxID=194707 RepID=A0AAN8VD70_9MAGN